MFTQCPKCQSVFMVSDENIRAHEGLVRCGNCYSVFNSSWNLTDDPRSDFVEEPISSEHAKPSASQGSGFIFNILGQKFAASHDSEGLDDQKIGESAELENQEVAETGDDSDLPDDEFLEPFPDPEEDQYLQTVKSEPEANKSQESLLYFDTDDVEEEEPVIESDSDTAEIEDLTLLQTPSFDNEIPTLNQDDSLLKPGDDENESSLITMTEESMWPGSEVSYADAGDDSDLPALDTSESDAGSSAPDVDENLHDQPDFSIDEELLEKQLLGYISLEDPEVDEQALADPLTEGLLTDQQSASEVQTKDPLAGVAQLDDLGDDWLLDEPESGAGELLQSEDEADVFEQIDDTFVASGKETEADEYFGLKSLPESAGEAFDLELDEEDETGAESVFITSEEDEIDDAYVPISLRLGDEGELLQGLDDFPGPGEPGH